MVPSVYYPGDDALVVTYGGHDFTLAPNSVQALEIPAARHDIDAEACVEYLVQRYRKIGLLRVPDPRDSGGVKAIIEASEAIHTEYLREVMGSVLARHQALQDEDRKRGLIPRDETPEVKKARESLKEWGLVK